MNKTLWTIVLAVAACASVPAHATITQTMVLDTQIAGFDVDGSAPWLRATFSAEDGDNFGTLKLESLLTGTDVVKGNANSAGWRFYLDLTDFTSYSCVGDCASDFVTGSFSNGKGGVFTLNLGWGPGGFGGMDVATYTLVFDSVLTTSPFGISTDGNGAGNLGGWASVAHIQSLIGGCSGWIGAHGPAGTGTVNSGQLDGPCTQPPPGVPEPAALGMFGFGTLLIGLFIGLRRRWV